ncbi:hypothetical protein FRC03_003931 [Tulasnella sp. 419]|nr:hypothetical protein FRC03_003931 [Tulasnella sp. 419]
MQGNSGNGMHGDEGFIGEWSREEWGWPSRRSNGQPSTIFLPSPVIPAACQGPCCSPTYHSAPVTAQPWHVIHQPAPLHSPQYDQTVGIPPIALVSQAVQGLVHPPALTEHAPTMYDVDVHGSPTVVSYSPLSAPRSPPAVTAADDQMNTSPPPSKLPPQKGRRCWTCQDCGKPFNRPSARDQHRMTHTGEKPHKCKICNVGFASKSNLKRHSGTQKCRRETVNYRARNPHWYVTSPSTAR